ncbi:kinase-like domain-containing protein [Mycena vulgaris]|nr:kinase-like domain-containing protein [Mycena vulgaris]
MIRELSVVGDKVFPLSIFVTGVSRWGDHPISGGGYSDVYRAFYRGKTVALKVIRMFHRGSEMRRLRMKICREALGWKQLSHTNILPLIGVDRDSFSPFLGLVSPWMEHGNALEYLKKQGRANVQQISVYSVKSFSVSCNTGFQLFEIAEGLKYLHSCNIVHGDLRGSNVLIDQQAKACIVDFGLSTLLDGTARNSLGRMGSLRWMAPELIDPGSFGCEFCPTRASDVYAYGCVCFELYTGQPLFADLSDIKAMFMIMGGSRPERPSSTTSAMSETLWQLVIKCWAPNSATRPTIETIVQNFRAVFQSGISPDKDSLHGFIPPMKQSTPEGTTPSGPSPTEEDRYPTGTTKLSNVIFTYTSPKFNHEWITPELSSNRPGSNGRAIQTSQAGMPIHSQSPNPLGTGEVPSTTMFDSTTAQQLFHNHGSTPATTEEGHFSRTGVESSERPGALILTPTTCPHMQAAAETAMGSTAVESTGMVTTAHPQGVNFWLESQRNTRNGEGNLEAGDEAGTKIYDSMPAHPTVPGYGSIPVTADNGHSSSPLESSGKPVQSSMLKSTSSHVHDIPDTAIEARGAESAGVTTSCITHSQSQGNNMEANPEAEEADQSGSSCLETHVSEPR